MHIYIYIYICVYTTDVLTHVCMHVWICVCEPREVLPQVQDHPEGHRHPRLVTDVIKHHIAIIKQQTTSPIQSKHSHSIVVSSIDCAQTEPIFQGGNKCHDPDFLGFSKTQLVLGLVNNNTWTNLILLFTKWTVLGVPQKSCQHSHSPALESQPFWRVGPIRQTQQPHNNNTTTINTHNTHMYTSNKRVGSVRLREAPEGHQPTFQTATRPQWLFSCTCSCVICSSGIMKCRL